MCCRTVIIALAKPHTLWLLWLRFNIEMRFKLPAQPHMFLCELSLQCLFLPVAQSTGGCRMLSMLGEGEWEFGSSLQFPKDSYLYTTTGPPPPPPNTAQCNLWQQEVPFLKRASLRSQLLYDHTLLLKRFLRRSELVCFDRSFQRPL